MSGELPGKERRELQGLIDRTAKASARFHREQATLNDWCLKRYGVEPGDIDADEIIDRVLGGCGLSDSMDAEEFHAIMTGKESDQ